MAEIWADNKRDPARVESDIHSRESCVIGLLDSIPTEDANREGLLETPKRVAKMYEELFAGYEMDYHKILSKQFTVDGKPSTIEVKGINFYSFS